jgi:sugar lactone lactonase YvrE
MSKRILGMFVWVVLAAAGPLRAAQWGILNGYKADVAPNLHQTVVVATEMAAPTPSLPTPTPTICAGCIYTVAGNGTPGYSGDNASATAPGAELNYPYCVTVDSSGNLFIADSDNKVVREVVQNTGKIITVAGGGASCPGDGGPALNACFSPGGLMGITADGSGNVFVADEDTNRVREVLKSTQYIYTVAGGNTEGGYGGDGDSATNSAVLLYSPFDVAVDTSGDIFIADLNNNRIREVVAATGDIITVAGSGNQGYGGDGGSATAAAVKLYAPRAVAVDGSGNIFIADSDNYRVREVVKATGNIITVAGNGTFGYSGDNNPATSAEMGQPDGIAVDTSGNIFISDMSKNVVREVVKATGNIITVAGNGTPGYGGDGGPATAAGVALYWPGGLAVDAAGDLFIADSNNHRIREVKP